MALNTEEKKSEPPSPHAHLSAEELYQSFLTTPSDRYRYDLAVEVAHRSQTDKAIVRRYVPLFDNSTYRSAVVYLLKHIEVYPSLMPDLETILDQLLLLEPARGSNCSESLRMGVYPVLGKYNAYAQAVL